MMYSAASLASIADDMTFLMMCEMFSTSALFGGTSAWLVRKKCPPAGLRVAVGG